MKTDLNFEPKKKEQDRVGGGGDGAGCCFYEMTGS